MTGHCRRTVFNLSINPNMSAFVSEESSTVPPPAAGRTMFPSSGTKRSIKRKASTEKEEPRKRLRTSESLEDTSRFREKILSRGRSSRKRQRFSELEENSEETTKSSGEVPKKRKRSHPAVFGGTSRKEFEAKYEQLSPLGAGNFGSVFAGYRREDGFPVAVKHIPRDNIICEGVPQNSGTVPLEVAIMLKVACGQDLRKSAVISLLDFYDLDEELILILERPVPAVDLLDHIEIKGGALQEEESQLILKQLVEAALELQSKNVFHRDIKAENILVETSTEVPRVKVIDFGLSCFTKKSSTFQTFYGTLAHIPPEWYQRYRYRPGPTTVWQIGVVLYDMLHKENRFETQSYLNKSISIREDLSPKCQEVLNLLLSEDPHQRPSLEELSCHPWLA